SPKLSWFPSPVLVHPLSFGLRASGVFALGNELLVTSAEQTQAAMVDISDPANPVLLPGSPFATVTRDGDAVETYHGTRVGDLALFARKEGGGGPMIMDVSDPTAPAFVGDAVHDGNAGYVFYDEGFLFVGESTHASVWDATDLANPTLVGTGDLAGDLDTNVPWGNVMLLSVDEPESDTATVVVPWRTDPDEKGPAVLATNPDDGTGGWYVGARVGIGFDEFVEPASAYPGSVRLLDGDGAPVEGWVSTQETIVTYTPKAPLAPGVTYTVEVDGVTDMHGNVMAGTHTFTFSTAGGR
ncbi:MAG: Ig-like domain-containing protein, partial [Myxococcota bacterium]